MTKRLPSGSFYRALILFLPDSRREKEGRVWEIEQDHRIQSSDENHSRKNTADKDTHERLHKNVTQAYEENVIESADILLFVVLMISGN